MPEKTITVTDAVRDALLTLTRRVEHEVGCATETHLSAACTCGLSNAINVVTAALATPQQEQVEEEADETPRFVEVQTGGGKMGRRQVEEDGWPAEVELVIDVCDDPPRPFLPRDVLDPEGAWRESDEYLTRIYVPAPTEPSYGGEGT